MRPGVVEHRSDGDTGSAALHLLVRAGFVARGLTYGMIGALALALALGASDGAATTQQGALAVVARAPLGKVAVLGAAVGLLAYAAWKFALTWLGTGPEGGGGDGAFDRVQNFFAGVSYLAFFAVAVAVLVGGGSGGGSKQTRKTTAGVLGWPGGRAIVFIAGTALVVISLVQIVLAWRGQFREDNKTEQMRREQRRWFTVLGQVGLVARALVFAIIGWFFVRAAVDFDPQQAIGVDGALRRVASEPYGSWLLGAVAAGLVVFALFSFGEARYRRL